MPEALRGAGPGCAIVDMDEPLVSACMTPDPLTLSPGDSLLEALETTRLRGVRHFPVAVAGVLVGPMTEGDQKRAEVVDLLVAVVEEVLEGVGGRTGSRRDLRGRGLGAVGGVTPRAGAAAAG